MKTNVEIAKEVIEGKWGTGTARERAIRSAGYDYNVIQGYVNDMIKTGKDIIEINADRNDCCGVVVNVI